MVDLKTGIGTYPVEYEIKYDENRQLDEFIIHFGDKKEVGFFFDEYFDLRGRSYPLLWRDKNITDKITSLQFIKNTFSAELDLSYFAESCLTMMNNDGIFVPYYKEYAYIMADFVFISGYLDLKAGKILDYHTSEYFYATCFMLALSGIEKLNLPEKYAMIEKQMLDKMKIARAFIENTLKNEAFQNEIEFLKGCSYDNYFDRLIYSDHKSSLEFVSFFKNSLAKCFKAKEELVFSRYFEPNNFLMFIPIFNGMTPGMIKDVYDETRDLIMMGEAPNDEKMSKVAHELNKSYLIDSLFSLELAPRNEMLEYLSMFPMRESGKIASCTNYNEYKSRILPYVRENFFNIKNDKEAYKLMDEAKQALDKFYGKDKYCYNKSTFLLGTYLIKAYAFECEQNIETIRDYITIFSYTPIYESNIRTRPWVEHVKNNGEITEENVEHYKFSKDQIIYAAKNKVEYPRTENWDTRYTLEDTKYRDYEWSYNNLLEKFFIPLNCPQDMINRILSGKVNNTSPFDEVEEEQIKTSSR